MASIKELQAKLDDLQARHDEMAKHNSCVTGLLKNVKAIEKQREDAPFEVTGLITMQDEIRVNGKDQEIDLPPTSIIASGMAAGQLVELSKLGWARIKCRGFDIADGESFVNKRGYLQSKYKQVRVMHVTVISTSEDSAEAATEQQGELMPQEA